MSVIGTIYMFRDPRFAVGVKVGFSTNPAERFRRAQCYGPEGMVCGVEWDIPTRWLDPETFTLGTLADAEAAVHRDAPHLLGPNIGEEFLDMDVPTSAGHVSARLGLRPTRIGIQPRLPKATYDDYRDPKRPWEMSDLYRQRLWIFVEHGTGRIKLQRNNWWEPNFSGARTYSRMGFNAVACFTRGTGNPSPTLGFGLENASVDQDWKDIVRDRGGDPDRDLAVGWLKRPTTVDDLRDRLLDLGYSELLLGGPRPPWTRAPRRRS